mmetsp:Transcript_5650/g.23951  ORF Transcript_5650/g.23951 Transcript_5650/m.23951 type:complete len:313 (-) Transcript_5650:173-1111(-)
MTASHFMRCECLPRPDIPDSVPLRAEPDNSVQPDACPQLTLRQVYVLCKVSRAKGITEETNAVGHAAQRLRRPHPRRDRRARQERAGAPSHEEVPGIIRAVAKPAVVRELLEPALVVNEVHLHCGREHALDVHPVVVPQPHVPRVAVPVSPHVSPHVNHAVRHLVVHGGDAVVQDDEPAPQALVGLGGVPDEPRHGAGPDALGLDCQVVVLVVRDPEAEHGGAKLRACLSGGCGPAVGARPQLGVKVGHAPPRPLYEGPVLACLLPRTGRPFGGHRGDGRHGGLGACGWGRLRRRCTGRADLALRMRLARRL